MIGFYVFEQKLWRKLKTVTELWIFASGPCEFKNLKYIIFKTAGCTIQESSHEAFPIIFLLQRRKILDTYLLWCFLTLDNRSTAYLPGTIFPDF